MALLARLLGGQAGRPPGGVFFSDKEPQDPAAERFERQY